MGTAKGNGPGCPRSRHGHMLLNGSERFAACSLENSIPKERRRNATTASQWTHIPCQTNPLPGSKGKEERLGVL